MMTILDWAARWRISQECFNELLATAIPTGLSGEPGASESRVQSLVRIEAAQHGVRLFRNNVGAGSIVDPDKLCELCHQRAKPSFVRYGLANDSKRVNELIKSHDLIGIGPAGKFFSREAKKVDWKWSGTAHELAQLAFANLINAHGGDAKIVNGTGSFK